MPISAKGYVADSVKIVLGKMGRAIALGDSAMSFLKNRLSHPARLNLMRFEPLTDGFSLEANHVLRFPFPDGA